MTGDFQKLQHDILEVRDCGEVTCCIVTRPPATDSVTILMDDFAARFGLVGLNEYWKEIDIHAAEAIAAEIILKDLAHGVAMTTQENASQLTQQFLGFFTLQPRFFTNASFESGKLSSWTPLSGSTFDTGVVCIDEITIGILWVQDED